MRRIALLACVLGAGAMASAVRAQAPVEPPSDPAGAATSAPLPGNAPPTPAPAAPMPIGPARISGSVMAANRISFVPPVYPEEARAAKLSGAVLLRVILSKDGAVEQAQVMTSTNHVFDQAAIAAVKQWRYRPFLLNGQPTEVDTSVMVHFSPEH